LVREPTGDLIALGVLFVLALAVRIPYLDVPLRYDEATTYVNYVSKPVHVALSNYSAPNNHLLHTAVAKLSVVLFGNGSNALRLPALVAGVALVPLTFALGRVLYGRSAALLAAALVASSSTLIEYSVNARGYTIVAALTVVAILAAARVVETNSLPAWALVSVAGALGLYAVPIMLYAIGGVQLWIAVSQVAAGVPGRRAARRVGASAFVTAALTGLLYAPVAVASGPRSVTSNEFVAPSSWFAFLERLPRHFIDTAETWGRDLPIPLRILLAVLLVVSLLLTPRLSRYAVPPLATILVWSLPVLAAQRVVPFTRVWLFAVPLAAVGVAGVLGAALDRVRTGRLLVPLAAVVVAAAGSAAVLAADSPRLSRETGGLLDAPAVAAYLAGVVRHEDRIHATGSDTILQYYLDRRGLDSATLLYGTAARPRIFVVVNVLGDQTIEQLVEGIGAERERYGEPRLLRQWPSAAAYLLELQAPRLAVRRIPASTRASVVNHATTGAIGASMRG
jgi:4-amino-4-deoxy-L-arabinose transferase-like glycosyltransferase